MKIQIVRLFTIH